MSFHMEKIMACITLHMPKICRKRIRSLDIPTKFIPCMQCASPPLVRPVIYCLMAKQVTWVIITIKTTIIVISQYPWLLKSLQALLIWFIHFSPRVGCNMSILVTTLVLYLIHQRKKMNLFPLSVIELPRSSLGSKYLLKVSAHWGFIFCCSWFWWLIFFWFFFLFPWLSLLLLVYPATSFLGSLSCFFLHPN